MNKHSIYTVGGTVQAGGGIYIKRKADDELLNLCRWGAFAFILSSRQVGKSSLMVRTANQLESEGIRSVIIDLSAVGVHVSQDEWYQGILSEIANILDLKTDIFTWWNQHTQLGATQRLTNFFRDVLLQEIQERIVLFFDEIDTTLSIPFSDDFFAAVRAVYNARSTTPSFMRLSFVLIGVATPSDLISDSRRTPFNVGQRVELTDFSLEEAMPLAAGLGENSAQVLDWVLSWTGGHPYLTQRLCAYLANEVEAITEQQVQNAVIQLFEGEQGSHDNNLQFVRDMLTHRAPNVQRVLKIYRDIRRGKHIPDDERSIAKAHLKITGVVCQREGKLVVRNRIYARAFDLRWIRENTPLMTTRQIAFVSSLVMIMIVTTTAFFAYQELTQTSAERAAGFVAHFQTANNPQKHLVNLAGLYELDDELYADQAHYLFFQLPHDYRKNLFKPSQSRSTREDQVLVVKEIYQQLNNVPDDNELLGVMSEAMKEPAPQLANEINLWLSGRRMLNEKKYKDAEADLTRAINLNPENPNLYFDRASALIGQGQDYYKSALGDLSQVIKLDVERRRAVRELIIANETFATYLDDHKRDFAGVASVNKHPIRRVIYDVENSVNLPGSVVWREGDPPTSDGMVNDVSNALGTIYDFFWTVYGRDSIDDKGMELQATVHYPLGYDGILWDGSQLVVGEANVNQPEEQKLFKRITTIDLITRNYVLGINQFEAELTFSSISGQSGALAISFGDVFGSLVKQYQRNQTALDADWIIGEGLLPPDVYNGVGLISLKAPGTAYNDPVLGKDPQPAHMKDYAVFLQDNNNQSAYVNSGIPNHAFYITAIEIGGYAWEKAGRIWYITLRDRLQPHSDFQDAANKTFQVAGELYGHGSLEQEAVRKGWAGVGIEIDFP